MNRPHTTFYRSPLLSPTRFIALFLAFAILLATFASRPAAAAPDASGLQLLGKSAILMDAATGQILYQNNAAEALPPASMTKMMTEYLVSKAVKEGKLDWKQTITVQENAAKQIGSRVFLAVGDKHTVEELYIAMAVGSANDATVQLAETVAGSEEAFAKLMNDTAKELGMKDSHFINSTGLDRADMPEAYRPSSIDGETVMSARDSAILAYHIINDYPEFLEHSKIPSFKFRKTDKDPVINWNWMLATNKDVTNFKKFAYPGVDGLKTGHTSKAGNCFTGTSLQNGTRLIAVVMGVPGGVNDGKRFLETAKLFDYGFNNFEKKTLVAAKSAVPEHETLKLKKGSKTKLPVITAKDITVMLPKGQAVEPTVAEVKPTADPLLAPVKQGDKVGTVTYKYKDPATQEEKLATVDLIAAEDVKKAGWFTLLLRGIANFFSGLFKGIVNLF
ncbi:D-alanyl-D-alanine carboxypeptidase family protein [Cohnella nanjingensis]|uniref:serine-type D-Ala-D-Ala carboxypeptidase n=1 Tax=Cohnella nanjingensis TaxID=1387779 RepID=A0A7X0VDZ1_9BACL|nr:D-alanyl-D-alanine carboxypeptidase family protein [Cohnella nanjingensis]MBB6670181.1 D-alanyl-D-alanine carboxypeptidase [Cohnella nanjingensis]